MEVDAAEIEPHHVVVELGAGTGPMTSEIVQRPHGPFVSLEPNAVLAAELRARFPEVRVEERYAQDLPDILSDMGVTHADRVISSLPWAIWDAELQGAVFDACLLYTSPSPRDGLLSRMPSSA